MVDLYFALFHFNVYEQIVFNSVVTRLIYKSYSYIVIVYCLFNASNTDITGA